MWYAKEMRQSIKAKNPSATVGEISKQLGVKWQDMNDDEKIPYVASARKDRERYEKEMAVYRARGDSQAEGGDEEEEEEEEEYSDEAED